MTDNTASSADENDNICEEQKKWEDAFAPPASFPDACEFFVAGAEKGLLMRYVNMRQPLHVFKELRLFTSSQLQQIAKWCQARYSMLLLSDKLKGDALPESELIDWRTKFIRDAADECELPKNRKRQFKEIGKAQKGLITTGNLPQYQKDLSNISGSLASELCDDVSMYENDMTASHARQRVSKPLGQLGGNQNSNSRRNNDNV